jgi:hypothetical protein
MRGRIAMSHNAVIAGLGPAIHAAPQAPEFQAFWQAETRDGQVIRGRDPGAGHDDSGSPRPISTVASASLAPTG